MTQGGMQQPATGRVGVERIPTGVAGLDEILGGGLLCDRITVLMGGPGTGKTLLALEFLARGVAEGHPGLFVGFEEAAKRIRANTSSFGWAPFMDDLAFIDADLSDTVMHDLQFDLNGLLAMAGARAEQVGARRVVLDGLDVLLTAFESPAARRREIHRLRNWLYETGTTALITVKADADHTDAESITGMLQYLADCVIELEHRLVGQAAVRDLRVSKCRGAAHSANRYPFAISDEGIVAASRVVESIDHRVLEDRVSTGVEALDEMLGGGYYRGSSVLITGAPGTAKTTLAGAFFESACRRGERALYVSYDEATDQIVRNLRSIGIDLAPHRESGLARIRSMRTRASDPHRHLATIARLLDDAQTLIVDPVSALGHLDMTLAEDAAIQLLDLAKSRGVTILSTSLIPSASINVEQTPIGLSTVADTWIHLAYLDQGGERNRALSVVKSRGMKHSRQVRELLLGDEGIDLAEVYTEGGQVLMGTLRWEREEDNRRHRARSEREAEQAERYAETALAELDARMRALEHERESRRMELERVRRESAQRQEKESARREGIRERRESGRAGSPADGGEDGGHV